MFNVSMHYINVYVLEIIIVYYIILCYVIYYIVYHIISYYIIKYMGIKPEETFKAVTKNSVTTERKKDKKGAWKKAVPASKVISSCLF